MATFDEERKREVQRGRYYTLAERGERLLVELRAFEDEIIALRSETIDADKQGEIDTRRAGFITQVKVILGI